MKIRPAAATPHGGTGLVTATVKDLRGRPWQAGRGSTGGGFTTPGSRDRRHAPIRPRSRPIAAAITPAFEVRPLPTGVRTKGAAGSSVP